MAWPGYFSYGGIEVINASRTEAYARHGNVGWFKPVYKESDLAWLLGEDRYTSALQDDAPWGDPENLDSYDFLGVYPLEVTGIEDSTVGATITESVIDGGYIGRSRRSTKAVVFNAVLAGLSECAVEYGLRWLRTVLSGNPCFGSAYGNCGGADLCYLACAPLIGDPPTTISPGPIVVDAINLATNPNAEVGQDGGWYTNDPAKWVVSAPTAGAISGTRSVMVTRQADALSATNLAQNPNLETDLVGWYSNDATRYPVTLDATTPLRGAQSAVTIRAGALSVAASSIYCGPVATTGFPCTPDQPITASLDVKSTEPNRKFGGYWSWLDASNGVIGNLPIAYSVPDSGAANTTWRAWVTGIPPAGAASARLILQSLTVSGNAVLGEKTWFDNLRVSAGPGTLDDTNQHPNPDLVSGSIGYWLPANVTSYPATLDTTSQMTGANSMVQTRGGSALDRFVASMVLGGTATPSSSLACTPGVPQYLGVDVKVERAGRRTETYFQWFDVAGVSVGTGARGAYTSMAAGVKTRLTYSEIPPAGAVMCRPVIATGTLDGSNAVVGERVWYDNSYFGTNPAAPSFSGSTPPDGTYVYRWVGTGGSWATPSERWKITGTEQTDITYFDGATLDTTVSDYRWTGAANASTSEKRSVSIGDPSAASLYFLSDASTIFAVTPGVPITLGIDVKVEQANRRIDGFFSWAGGGSSPTVSIQAGPAGSVTRLVMTGTPPAGVTAVYPVVTVNTTSGPALNGERTWWDNLYVGNLVSGDYFDGSTPEDGDLSYGWTGADNASASRRFVQTWVNDPPPPPEECYERVGRSLHEVTVTVGPSVTAKMEMNDGGVAWTVTWTAVAANPVEFGVERPLIVGFLDPAVDIPYAGGAVPEGGGFDEDGYVQTEVKCPTAGFVPVFDPLCKLLVPPPDVPAVAATCFSFPVNYTRRSFVIPKTKIPLWGQVVPVIQLTTTTAETRSVRLRFYADVFDTGSPNDDPCNYCGDMLVSYIPAGSTLVLDGTDHSVYIDQPGQGRRRADSLVSDSSGNPFEWPEFSCGFGYVVTVDLPQQTAKLPIVDLALVPRAA